MNLDLASEYRRGVDYAGCRVQERLHHDPTEHRYVQAQRRSRIIENIRCISIGSFGGDERGQSEVGHLSCVNYGKDRQIRLVTGLHDLIT